MKLQLTVLKKHLEGLLSYTPYLYNLAKRTEVGGVAGATSSAAYCYNVFWRHVQKAEIAGIPALIPEGSALELGPGGSLGTGLCALLSGFERYSAVDVVPFAENETRNIAVFRSLIKLFDEEAPLYANDNIWPVAPDLEFPQKKIPALKKAGFLAPDRLSSIEQAIKGDSRSDVEILYCHPREMDEVLEPSSIDWTFSQAVFEHVEDIEDLHGAVLRVLRVGGFCSHVIDFKSHGTSKYYNGHYRYSPRTWHFLMGRRVLLSNRRPPSAHIAILESAKMEVLRHEVRPGTNGLQKDSFHHMFREMADEDAYASSSFILATKSSSGEAQK